MQDARRELVRLTIRARRCSLIIRNILNYETANVKKFAVSNVIAFLVKLPLFLVAVFFFGGS